MRIEDPMNCVILGRVNKFVVRVLLEGRTRRAYISNTGRLPEHIVEGRKGFCIRPKRPGKTDCLLFSVREDSFAAIIDTQLQMKVFEKALGTSLIPWARRCRILSRNAKLGTSLIDYLLECGNQRVYLEVKSAVMKEGENALYPDCPSSRGRKHVAELTEQVEKGGHGTMLFIAALPGVKAFRPNKSADPEMCRLLTRASEAGVDVRALGMYYDPNDSYVYLFNPDLPVNLF